MIAEHNSGSVEITDSHEPSRVPENNDPSEFVKAICYHEAGHAILGFYAGLSIIRIEMDISVAGESKSITVARKSDDKVALGIYFMAGLVSVENLYGMEWLEKNNRRKLIFAGDDSKLIGYGNIDEIRTLTNELYKLHEGEVSLLAEEIYKKLLVSKKALIDWNQILKVIRKTKLFAE